MQVAPKQLGNMSLPNSRLVRVSHPGEALDKNGDFHQSAQVGDRVSPGCDILTSPKFGKLLLPCYFGPTCTFQNSLGLSVLKLLDKFTTLVLVSNWHVTNKQINYTLRPTLTHNKISTLFNWDFYDCCKSFITLRTTSHPIKMHSVPIILNLTGKGKR